MLRLCSTETAYVVHFFATLRATAKPSCFFELRLIEERVLDEHQAEFTSLWCLCRVFQEVPREVLTLPAAFLSEGQGIGIDQEDKALQVELGSKLHGVDRIIFEAQ